MRNSRVKTWVKVMWWFSLLLFLSNHLIFGILGMVSRLKTFFATPIPIFHPIFHPDQGVQINSVCFLNTWNQIHFSPQASMSVENYRPGFDISLPLFHRYRHISNLIQAKDPSPPSKKEKKHAVIISIILTSISITSDKKHAVIISTILTSITSDKTKTFCNYLHNAYFNTCITSDTTLAEGVLLDWPIPTSSLSWANIFLRSRANGEDDRILSFHCNKKDTE